MHARGAYVITGPAYRKKVPVSVSEVPGTVEQCRAGAVCRQRAIPIL